MGKKDKHAITNSWGVYDFYKYYRKTKPEGNKWVLTESQYFAIFRRVNEILVDGLIKTGELVFPYRTGKLVVIKTFGASRINSKGQRVTSRNIDWNKTLELWYNDADAYKDKTLLYFETPRLSVRYNKREAVFKNKYFYDFKPNRDITKRLHRESVVSLIINRELTNQIKGLYDG